MNPTKFTQAYVQYLLSMKAAAQGMVLPYSEAAANDE